MIKIESTATTALVASEDRYYIDTCGAWMIDALFDDDLHKLEARHKEYLAFLVNAFANPKATFLGILPTSSRKDHKLPTLYEELGKRGFLSSELSIGATELEDDKTELERQFRVFCCHLRHYPTAIQRVAKFHSHGKVSGGFFGATGRPEKTPGVPDFVEEFLTHSRCTEMRTASQSVEVVWAKQAFAIFQRGYKYAASALLNNARYMTHPLRWSAIGQQSTKEFYADWTSILGGIAATAIERKTIKNSSDLLNRLKNVRDAQPKWVSSITTLQNSIWDSTTETQERSLKADLRRYLIEHAAPWVDGDLSSSAEKVFQTLVFTLWSLFAVTAVGAGTAGAATVGATAVVLTAIKPSRLSPNRRVPRHWVNYHIESIIPQSCVDCGAPRQIMQEGSGCPVCECIKGSVAAVFYAQPIIPPTLRIKPRKAGEFRR